MGAFLPVPVTTKVVERHENSLRLDPVQSAPRFRVGVSSMNGWRCKMEDTHLVTVRRKSARADGYALFGVFDGHGGNECSRFLAQKLPANLQSTLSDNALKDAVLQVDEEFLNSSDCLAGSTGTFAVVTEVEGRFKLQVGNVGDSRVVLGRRPKKAGDAPEAVLLTTDHRPSDQLEMERIKAADGHVENDRVNGDLAMSRAFGDRQYKCGGAGDPRRHQVIAEPDVTHADCLPRDILVLCCDGVFERDVFTPESLVNYVFDQLQSSPDLASIAASVCDEAVSRGSKDNVTCLIVELGVEGDGGQPASEVLPGPVSAPGNARFMAAYSEAARAGGMTAAQCVESRHTYLVKQLQRLGSRDSDAAKELIKEMQTIGMPDELQALPPGHRDRVKYCEQWLERAAREAPAEDQLYSGSYEEDDEGIDLTAPYAQPDEVTEMLKHKQGNLQRMVSEVGVPVLASKQDSAAWRGVLEALQNEVEDEEEEEEDSVPPVSVQHQKISPPTTSTPPSIATPTSHNTSEPGDEFFSFRDDDDDDDLAGVCILPRDEAFTSEPLPKRLRGVA